MGRVGDRGQLAPQAGTCQVNVVVVGNTGVSVEKALEITAEFLSHLDTDTRILLRSPINDPPNPLEENLARQAEDLGLEVVWCYPDRRGGREGTYVRDAHMAGMADLVLAFFLPGKVMTGGTGHVVEKALDKDIPIQAYELDESGLTWVGSV
jgi:hypothetical protein